MHKSKNPSIINISSIYGVVGPDWSLYSGTEINNPAAYSISKAGIVHMTKWLASTLAPKIRVNCISPVVCIETNRINLRKNIYHVLF